MALTVKKVAQLHETGRYHDERGLYLEVNKTGGRSWVLRYERADTRPGYEGKRRERWMGLGPVADFTLDEARESARKARQLLHEGIDPIDARKDERSRRATEAAIARAKNVTFEQCARQYYDKHSVKWKNAKHSAQFLSTLKMYAYPVLGNLPVAAIDMALVAKALRPIWLTKNETASRVRGRIEAVLDYAKVNEYRTGDNPAAWAGNLIHDLPAPGTKVKHHAALPFRDLPAFLVQLTEREGMAARALELLILTAARTSEITNARWSEIDFDKKEWTIPAERMKAKKEHRVPLTDRALSLLKALPREAEYVFLGGTKGAPISNMAMAELLKRMERRDITVHGFRSTFRDWAAETTAYPNHVVEMALAHTIDLKVEKAYRRGDLFPKRTKLMADWEKFCSRPVVAADNVTPLRGRA